MQSAVGTPPAPEIAASLAAQRAGLVGLSPRLEKRIAHVLSLVHVTTKPLGEESSFQEWGECNLILFELAPRNTALAARILELHVPVLVIASWADVWGGIAGAPAWASGFLVDTWSDEQLLASLLSVAAAGARPRKSPPRRATPLVLIADDDAALTDLLEAVLGQQQFSCRVAPDGPAALRLIRELQPDVVLLDVKMPGMTGFEVLAKVRQDPLLQDVAIALLTACDDDTAVMEGSRLEADDYIVKPLRPEWLGERIRSLLRRRANSNTATRHGRTL